MANRIILRKGTTVGAAPSAAVLQPGELAINTADGALYVKLEDNSVYTLVPASGAAIVNQTISASRVTAGTFGSGAYSGMTSLSVTNAVTAGSIVTPTTVLNGNSYTWPLNAGTSGQVLTTDGAGNVLWATTASLAALSGTPGRIAKFQSTSLISDSIMSESGSTITVSGEVSLSTGNAYKINGTSVLSASALGSGVTSSSLTSVGTLTTGVWQATAVAVAYGGTGATDASTARTNLGLAIGTHVQAWDADLDAIAALSGTSGLLRKTAANTWSLDTNTYLTGITSSDVTTALGFTPENAANKGQANGYASLDATGKVPSSQLPASTGGSLEYANVAAFPGTGQSGIIYVALDTGKIYRWTGTGYAELSPSPASTDNLSEGSTNLYFTTARARTSISATGSLSYNNTTGVLSYTQPTNVSTFSNDAGYLTANQTVTLSGDVTGSGSTAITTTLANSGVVAGTYNDVATQVRPFTVDAKGRITSVGTAVTIAPAWSSITSTPTTLAGYGITDAQPLDADLTAIAGLSGTSGLLRKTAADTWSLDTASYLTSNQSITLSGDATGSGTTAITVTLANSGVVAGTYNDSATQVRPFTVDAKGRVTSIGSAVTITPAWSSITNTPTTLSGYGITDAQPVDADLTAIAALSGTTGLLRKTGANTWTLDTATYLTGITSSDVTTALGFTPENSANKGQANGYASLDAAGKVPSAQLPSYVDDVLEYANTAAFPGTGETGKIYVAIDTGKIYRWSGSAYVEISPSPGSTDAVPEGSTNLYFTTARARNAISATGSLSYNSTTGVISYTQPTNVSTFSNDAGYLTANQSITLSGDVTGSGTTAITTTLANSGVVAGTYNDVATQVRPFTVDAKGRVTAVGTAVTITPAWSSITSTPTTLAGYGITDAQPLDADLTAIAGLSGTSGLLRKTAADTWSLDTNTYLTGNQTITLSGDVSGSGTTGITATLATVNSNVGSFGGASTVPVITVNGKGLVTAVSTATVVAAAGTLTGNTLAAGVTASSLTSVGTIATGVWQGTAVAVAYGGTGATDAATARTNLGLAIGTNVQAWDADLDAIAALAGTSGLLRKTDANTWALDTNTYLTGNQTITLSGDVTGSGTTGITTTLATVNSNTGSFGAASTIPVITVNGKGLVTAVSTATVVAAAGTLTGNTLASGVTSSSLTSLGTLSSLAVSGTTAFNGVTYTWPASAGSNGQVLTSNGSGGLSWTTATGGGGASVTISETAPSTPAAGNLWWDSTYGALRIYYNDGTSSQWVDTGQGPVGPQGPQGVAGTAATLSVGTVTTGAAGSSVSVTNSGTSSAAVLNFTIPRGDAGTNGTAATISVGTVTTGAAGSSATVTNAGTSSAAVFNFSIPRGDTGATGSAATVSLGTVSTGAAGSLVSITNSGTSSAAVLNFTIPRGDTGAAGTVAVGTVTTGAAGSSATVTNSGTASAAVLDFTIPRGDTGAAGTAATVAVGTVTTGAAGSSATVTNSGTSSAATLNFTIPRGDTGATGPIGPKSTLLSYPTTSDTKVVMFYTTSAQTLSKLVAVLPGATNTPSLSYNVRYGSNVSLTGTAVTSAANTVTNTTTGTTVTSFNNATISAGSFVWVEVTAVSGTIPSFSLTLEF